MGGLRWHRGVWFAGNLVPQGRIRRRSLFRRAVGSGSSEATNGPLDPVDVGRGGPAAPETAAPRTDRPRRTPRHPSRVPARRVRRGPGEDSRIHASRRGAGPDPFRTSCLVPPPDCPVSDGRLGALGIWAFFSGDHWGGLLLVLVSIAAAVQEFRKQVSSIEIRDRSIVVRTLLRPRAIAFDDISDVRIALKSAGNGYSILDVALVLNDDSAESVLPIGCDPISLYRTLKSELGH